MHMEAIVMARRQRITGAQEVDAPRQLDERQRHGHARQWSGSGYVSRSIEVRQSTPEEFE